MIDWVDEPAAWTLVLLPAMSIALIVRWDATKIGPYFALSDLISALPPTNARDWYEDKQLRRALQRRFLYPVLLGISLQWLTNLAMTDICAAGFLTAALLLWPLIFQGLPWWIPTKTWHLPMLYLSFLIAYTTFTLGGALLQVLLARITDGDVINWLTNELLSTAIVWAFGLFALSVFNMARRRTDDEASRRRAMGGERVSGHDDTEK